MLSCRILPTSGSEIPANIQCFPHIPCMYHCMSGRIVTCVCSHFSGYYLQCSRVKQLDLWSKRIQSLIKNRKHLICTAQQGKKGGNDSVETTTCGIALKVYHFWPT